MNIKERLSDWEYQWAVAIVYAGCISTIPHSLGAVDPLFSPKDSYCAWLTLLIAALLSNLLFDPRGRDCYKSLQVEYPKFFKAIFKARFFGAFYNAVLGSRLRDFYMMLLTMPFIAAIHEVSAYCGHPSNFLVEGLVILGFLVCFGICSRLCAKLGW
ncbi:hypothetical protein [Helicobacter pylori]|uniref:hypothetical protein n=1 Tax=Helicobacter pylori TaxID=210 RepID=UPI00099298B6|nr:hypothetical protein [Helicobacter pylori]OOP88807.1 hypothetical protein B0X39_05715 [Helicobacter pylori]PDW91946.1 hypothetical protein BB392_00750 [Helicobacter pylori]